MRLLFIALLLALVAGCATVTKVETGEQAVGGRLFVNLEGPWNRIDAPGIGPAQVWTMEGLPVDQLLVYSGIKNGELVHASGGSGKTFAFRATMQPHEVVAMFEGMMTRDGSQFKLARLDPVSFVGGKGFRFEYAVVRRSDGAQLSGVAYGIVNEGELYAMLYHAPRLTFFPRHRQRVENMARSAHIKQVDTADYRPDPAAQAQCAKNPSLAFCNVDRSKRQTDPAAEAQCARNPSLAFCQVDRSGKQADPARETR
jgi:hypothetical protein